MFNFVVCSGSISKGVELVLLVVGVVSKCISDLEVVVGVLLLEWYLCGVMLIVVGLVL